MKKIRFTHDEGNQFYHILQYRVNAMLKEKKQSRLANRLMIFKITAYLLLLVICYAIICTSTESVIKFYLAYFTFGFIALLLAFNVSHDAAHHAIFSNKKHNELLFAFTWHLLGNNAYVWRKYHIESHHLYTNVHGSDVDVLDNPLLRMTTKQPLHYFHRFQHLYAPILYLFYSLNWLVVRDTMQLFGRSDRSIAIKLSVKQKVSLVFHKLVYVGYMIALPFLLLPFGLTQILIAFVLMHFMMSIIIAAVLGVSHLAEEADHPHPHSSGEMSHSWVTLQMRTSLDYDVDNRLLNWLLGGFNAHTVHHLFPNVCHIHYLDIVPIMRQTAREFGLTYNECHYRHAAASHFRFLKRMGHEL